MNHPVVSREEWLAARAALLQEEKALTRARATLAARRRELPWVQVTKKYTLTGSEGPVPFPDLFKGHSQLAIYHLMFGPGWRKPCSGCTQWANALDGTTSTFAAADARLIVVSSAPMDEIEVMREKMGWRFDWYSAGDSGFNVDYLGASTDRSNLSTGHAGTEQVTFDRGENHAANVFFRNDTGEIFHTYSAFNRGIEELNGALGWFDLLPKGRAW